MAAFVCEACHRDPTVHDAVIRYRSERFTIEVAAKSADGKDRPRQVTLRHSFCKRHAVEFVNRVDVGATSDQLALL